MWPFVYFDESNLEGTEQRILKEFEKYENVKIELHAVMKQTNIHGVIMPGYVDDILKKVQDNEFEGSIGGHITHKKNYTYPIIANHATYVMAHANN